MMPAKPFQGLGCPLGVAPLAYLPAENHSTSSNRVTTRANANRGARKAVTTESPLGELDLLRCPYRKQCAIYRDIAYLETVPGGIGVLGVYHVVHGCLVYMSPQ